VTTDKKESFDREWITATFTDLIIRFSVLAILVYFSLVLVRPFITIVIWSAVLAVALYPAFGWLALRLGNRRRLAAFLITIVSLLIVIGPATWLALDLIESLRSLSERLDPSLISLPAPPEAVKSWPLIGDQIYQSWHLASINTKEALTDLAPHLKPLGSTLLRIAADGGASALQFLISIIVAGFLFCPGPSIVKSVKLLSRRLAPDRAEGFVDLAGATIRAVSQGVIGVSVLQALLAGLGLTAVGIPSASLITSAVLILGIVQIGPSVVIIPAIIWSWVTMETTTALLFTAYMMPVNLLDNILKPFVMTRGLRTPMLVIAIGVIGGTLGYGITGLFLGPIVLTVFWELIAAWVAEASPSG
jgi:predicted PurR-regulated permease PerM